MLVSDVVMLYVKHETRKAHVTLEHKISLKGQFVTIEMYASSEI